MFVSEIQFDYSFFLPYDIKNRHAKGRSTSKLFFSKYDELAKKESATLVEINKTIYDQF